jgi:hypothetical protein
MTNTITSQNIDLFSWDTLYILIKVFWVVAPCDLVDKYQFFKYHFASLFRLELCKLRNGLNYTSRFQSQIYWDG